MEEFVDQRIDKRFKAQDGLFVTLSTADRKNWQIIDIGKGGLSFRYVPEVEDLNKSSELDLVTHDTVFSLDKISFKSISDAGIDEEFLSKYTLSRHGVAFGELTPSQSVQLELLIDNYTVGEI
ncbi:hypothetical protein ACFL9T_15835 [Thermodesulfobacteriota bacterium]